MGRVFVSGEAIIDFVPDHTASGEPCFVPKPGGSPMNTTKAAAMAGAQAEFVGALSTDFLGDMLHADLEASGAGTGLTPRIDRPSTLAFVDVSQGSPRYAFHLVGTADEEMKPSLDAVPPMPGDIVHVGSIALAGPAASRITDFAVAEGERRLVSLDPNVRDAVIGNRTKWHGRIDRITKAAAILKLSTEDLDYMQAGADPAEFARAQLERGPALVVVSGGEEGATAYTRSGEATMAAPRVEVADTVGAGDTLMGSMLAWIVAEELEGHDALAALDETRLTQMLRFATTAAAINCTRRGCNPPSREEIVAFMA